MMQTIKERIKQRRFQIIVHSYIYYELNDNIVSDAKWSKWAKELVELQKLYPEESSEVIYADAFKDFDGSTGFNLPRDAWVQNKASYLLRIRDNVKKKPKIKSKTKKLF